MIPTPLAVGVCSVLLLVSLVAGQEIQAQAFKTIQECLSNTGTLSKFASSVGGTELARLFAQQSTAVTVFAPNDAAWEAVASATSAINSSGHVTLVQYHVANSVLERSKLADKAAIPTRLQGGQLRVQWTRRNGGGGVVIAGKYSQAALLSSIRAGKSVVYVIDAVLFPFPLPLPSAGAAGRGGVASATLAVFHSALQKLPAFLRQSGASLARAVTPTSATLNLLAGQRRNPPVAPAPTTTTTNEEEDNSTAIPPSPYTPNIKVCGRAASYQVFGFNSSPVAIEPFTLPFKNPTAAVPSGRVCRSDSHCLTAYTLDVREVEVDLGCPRPTTMLAFNGSVPGPTFFIPVGEETLVRVSNSMAGGKLSATGEGPCEGGEGGRAAGLPITVHNHGQTTLASWDGWAENMLCPGETKDYVYPNNRPNTGWYHDHSLALTAKHVYHGLAGFYIPTVKRGYSSNCGEPWGLDRIPDFHLMVNDKRFTADCQLDIDVGGVDRDNQYGDINTVSGTPWPLLTVHPTSIRLRFLNAALSRAYKVLVADAKRKHWGAERAPGGSGARCKVVATDGGFLPEPVDLPAEGLFVGVAERYELVCDLRDLGGRTLYLWNVDDAKRTAGQVPFFCYSHLVMKIKVLKTCPAACTLPPVPLPLSPGGGDVLCGGSCFMRPAPNASCPAGTAYDRQMACCPEGQYCLRQNTTHHVCRATTQPAPTCWLPGALEPTPFGMRCGGACFHDATCRSASEARACCPAGQHCWHADDFSWLCRPNPAVGPAASQPPAPASCPLPQPVWGSSRLPTIMDPVLSQGDYETAMAMVEANTAHRYMTFDRGGGIWTINGQTWNDFKIAVDDIGQGTWEVWRLTVVGGWYHPIHIHLVDFWVLGRSGGVSGVIRYPYEEKAVKDVISLSPGEAANLLIRWGPHRGDYMFHCHNLIHEDRLMLRAVTVDVAAASRTSYTALPGNGSTLDFTTLSTATSIVYDSYNRKDPMADLPTTAPPALDPLYLQTVVDANNYMIFYPDGASPGVLLDPLTNPWRVATYRGTDVCPLVADGAAGGLGGGGGSVLQGQRPAPAPAPSTVTNSGREP